MVAPNQDQQVGLFQCCPETSSITLRLAGIPAHTGGLLWVFPRHLSCGLMALQHQESPVQGSSRIHPFTLFCLLQNGKVGGVNTARVVL